MLFLTMVILDYEINTLSVPYPKRKLLLSLNSYISLWGWRSQNWVGERPTSSGAEGTGFSIEFHLSSVAGLLRFRVLVAVLHRILN